MLVKKEKETRGDVRVFCGDEIIYEGEWSDDVGFRIRRHVMANYTTVRVESLDGRPFCTMSHQEVNYE